MKTHHVVETLQFNYHNERHDDDMLKAMYTTVCNSHFSFILVHSVDTFKFSADCCLSGIYGETVGTWGGKIRMHDGFMQNCCEISGPNQIFYAKFHILGYNCIVHKNPARNVYYNPAKSP